MEKNLLPNISNWKISNGIRYHIFKYSNIDELIKIKNILEKFIKRHSNFYICNNNDLMICQKI